MESFQLDNLAEEEFGQLQAYHFSEDRVAAFRAAIPKGPSLEECLDCGEAIPEARRRAVAACQRCIDCQTIYDRYKR